MRHEKKLIKAMEDFGFSSEKVLGFLRFRKDSAEFSREIDIFQWSNPKYSNTTTIPVAYYVFDIYLTPVQSGRFRLPLVEWEQGGSNPEPKEQVYLPFDSVFDELYDKFLRLYELPAEEAIQLLPTDSRYIIQH